MTATTATVTTATSGITGGYTTSTSKATIQSLKTAMSSGKIIKSADVNSLVSLWNAFNGHSHTVNDLVGIKTYGNTNNGYQTYLGYYSLSYDYYVAAYSYHFGAGTFTGTLDYVNAQYAALPNTRDSNIFGIGTKEITSGPAPVYGTVPFSTSGTYTPVQTSVPVNLSGDTTTVLAGNKIQITEINNLISVFSNSGSHSHTWTDNIS